MARTRQTHPVLGESSALSGYELAVQINMRLATFGLPMTPSPSPVPSFPENPVSGLSITGTGGAPSLKLVLSAQPVEFIVVLGARAQNPGVSYVDHYKILGLLPEPEGGLSDITDLYLAAFKLLPAGKRVFIQALQQINGWRDPASHSCLWTACRVFNPWACDVQGAQWLAASRSWTPKRPPGGGSIKTPRVIGRWRPGFPRANAGGRAARRSWIRCGPSRCTTAGPGPPAGTRR